MSLSNLQKAGSVASQAAKNPLVRAGFSALQGLAGGATRAARQLFLQVTSTFFAAFALAGGFALVREYRQWTVSGSTDDKNALIIAIVWTVVFGYFAVSGFWKARR